MNRSLKFYLAYFFLLNWAFPPMQAQNSAWYFPPLVGPTWESRSPLELNWCNQELQDLHQYLDSVQTKAFIVLHQGRLVSEQYFNNFGPDSLWYWASAGKTLTAFLVGQAQERNLLNIQDRSNLYLGRGWTSMDSLREDSITLWHHLTMTTGLDYRVADLYCTLDTCLHYFAAAGTSWYYHNAPYTLLDSVLRVASGLSLNNLSNQWLKNRIGMGGNWFRNGFNNVYFSNARSMARFGSMIAAGGRWGQDTLLKDRTYFQQMISPSQNLNPAYGYLWWLNGQSSFRIPQTSLSFNGSLIPEAPNDMYMALGRDDQKIYIVPSLDLVIIRLGEAATGFSLASSAFDRVFWTRFMRVLSPCTTTAVQALDQNPSPLVYPNPFHSSLSIVEGQPWQIYNSWGQMMAQGQEAQTLNNCSAWPNGLYVFQQGETRVKLIKN